MSKEDSTKTIKIELNNRGEYIAISTADTNLFDRFTAGYRQIAEMAEQLHQKRKEIEQRSKHSRVEKIVEVSRVNVNFSKDAVEIIDNIFGRNTIRKYFRKLYKKVPDFMPGTECFIDFYNQMAPILEKLLDRKIDDCDKERVRSMGQ